MTTNCKPSLNARLAVSRSRARLFQIRRGFVVMTKAAFFRIYLSLVRPILEYAIQAVSPYQQKDIDLTVSPEAVDWASERSLTIPV